jgi:hypothetical protein
MDIIFYVCDKLKNIYCKASVPPAIWYQYVSSAQGTFPFNSGMKIFVPIESYSAYTQYTSTSNGKVAQTNWYAYKSYIQPYDFE